ncbi:MAG: hypothetical protein FJZ61_04430 [Chlamydiae bacterium]|nr:hypothetical protein [Chlamydiota bacterium]
MKVNRPEHNPGHIQHATIGRLNPSDKLIKEIFKNGCPKPHKPTFKFEHHKIKAQNPTSSEKPLPKKNKRA